MSELRFDHRNSQKDLRFNQVPKNSKKTTSGSLHTLTLSAVDCVPLHRAMMFVAVTVPRLSLSKLPRCNNQSMIRQTTMILYESEMYRVGCGSPSTSFYSGHMLLKWTFACVQRCGVLAVALWPGDRLASVVSSSMLRNGRNKNKLFLHEKMGRMWPNAELSARVKFLREYVLSLVEDKFDLENAFQTKAEFSCAIAVMDKM